MVAAGVGPLEATPISHVEVRFHEVGREKKSWNVKVKRPATAEAVLKLVMASGTLMSRNITVEMDPMSFGAAGWIYAGLRQVGTFEVADAV